MKKPAPGTARAEGGTRDSLSTEQEAPSLDEFMPRPRTPRLFIAWSWGRCAHRILCNESLVVSAAELELKDIARFIRSGAVQIPGGHSLANTAERALAGNADAYRYVLEWLDQHSTIRHKLDAARRKERELPENLPAAVRDYVMRAQPREKSALELEAERLGLSGAGT